MKFICAAVQMNSSDDLRDNLKRAAILIEKAAGEGAQLVVLPETFAFIGKSQEQHLDVREPLGRGPIQDFLAGQAGRHKVWLVGGTLPLESPGDDRAYAACLLFDAAGARAAVYHKVHLFDVDLPARDESYRESAVFKPGEAVVVADTPFGGVGLAVCYDLRFPEMFRRLLDRGADIIALPSAFTATTGRAHWETLLRARAIENQAWVIGSAEVGTHANNRETYGHSAIVDPWGVVRASVANGEGIVAATIDRAEQMRLRERFPCLTHRVFTER